MKSKSFLKKIKLENFKCYENTTINFKELSIIVGENNAGKSCLVEALRLIATAAQQAKSRTYRTAPTNLKLPLSVKGFDIKTEKLKINLNLAVYFYKDTIAKITAWFSDSIRIEIHITNEIAFATLFDSEGTNIKYKSNAKKVNFNRIGILPQIGLIRDKEKILFDKTIIEDKDTYLTSLHFRNEIRLYNKDYFEDFKMLSENTWTGLKVENVELNYGSNEFLSLFLTDNAFTAEVADMGSGIKMWLQIMWFLARTKNYDIIILDEPDVYMHADLQRKLLDIVKERYPQVVIATHSLEIIGRVEPENILSVSKKDKQLKYATDSNAAQNIVDNIGGMQNLSLIRLGLARKCLFVEGKDLPFLNRFNEVLYGKKLEIPVLDYGGFSKLSNVYGAANLLFSESQGSIICYALADKDYRTLQVNDSEVEKAINQHLELHIWSKKEIENYLINTDVLYRIIEKKGQISFREFLGQIENLVEELKNSVEDGYATKLQQDNRSKDLTTCNIEAREIVSKKWTTLDNKISLVNGKDLLARVRDYFKSKFKITLTNSMIQSNFTTEDICDEMKNILSKLQ